MESCVFCKMDRNEIAVEPILENEQLFVIKDKAPKASIHYLIIPKKHLPDILSMQEVDFQLGAAIFATAQQLSQQLNNTDFKLVVNNGYSAGQRVFHLHIHFLAGKDLSEM